MAKYEDQQDQIEDAERRVRMEGEEEKRIGSMESDRIATEEGAMKEGENEDWINTVGGKRNERGRKRRLD